MLDRKLVISILLSFATLLAFNYFFRSKPTEPVVGMESGKFYNVLSQEELATHQERAHLVSREIDFVDTDTPGKKPEQITSVQTAVYSIKFSNYGGSIASVSYPKRRGTMNVPLTTITPKDFDHREEAAFLLALPARTPYFYNLDYVKEHDSFHEVAYSALANGWKIQKIFTVPQESYQIGLRVVVTPLNEAAQPLQLRLFVPSPLVSANSGEKLDAFVAGVDDKKVALVSSQDLLRVTPKPSLLGVENRYFAHGLVRDAQLFAQMAYFKQLDGSIISILAAAPVATASEWSMSFYVGPKDLQDLSLVDARLEGLLNFGLLSWLCKLLLTLLTYLFGFLGNYGLAIIALTLLIKIPLLPLSMKSATVQEQQKKYGPHIARIRAQYRNDPQRMVREIQLFYKEHNMSTTGSILGMLPMLIDIPIMLALYNVLGNYIDLYHAPFLWMADLSARDPYFILPVLMGVSMFLQQRMTPVPDEKMRMIGLFMTLVFTVISANLAAGLVLYWLVKNILTIGENFLRRIFVPQI